jgi:signal peptidase II
VSVLYIIGIIVLDQITKYIAKIKLYSVSQIDLIKGFFSLTYVENRGAAFGIFRDKRIILVGFTAIVIAAMIFYLIKGKSMNRLLRISLTLIIAGAIGNLIDRISLGYVVDFFHLYIGSVVDWPVFNVADISIVCGTILLAINLLFSKE